MGNKIFLTAEPRTGKTTAIQKIVELVGKDNCQGFYTEEIRKDKERTGFDCITLTGKKFNIADVNSKSNIRVSRYGVNLEEFDQIIIPILEQSLFSDKLLIIDEIGPMELFSERFKSVLNKVLNSNKNILGTIFFNPHPEVDKIKKNSNITLFSLTKENRDTLPYEIAKKIINM